MELSRECPCCGSVKARSRWALVAPFVRHYALGPDAPFTAQLRECQTCGHRYFRERYTNEELARLYGGYREEAYLKARQRWEPWYSARLNSTGLDPQVIAGRQNQLRELLRQMGWREGERRVVVDVGGDAGQFIPLDLAREAYVVEASGRAPVIGVQRVAGLADVPEPIGLLLCQHVLEHLPDPAGFLKELVASGSLAPGCLVVLEVPLERPWLGPLLGSRLYRGWLELVGRWRWLAIGVDFVATALRGFLGVVVVPYFLKLHEHVQFFTAATLRLLALEAGLENVREETVHGSSLRTHQGVLRLVARVDKNQIEAAIYADDCRAEDQSVFTQKKVKYESSSLANQMGGVSETKAMPPRISIVTGTAGRINELERLRDSLTHQTLKQFEWIVVDQNTDNRVERILSEVEGIVSTKHLSCQPNLSAALNLGANAAISPIIGFPDDDCWFEPKLLNSIVDLFAENPRWDAVVCRVVDENGKQAINGWRTTEGSCNRFNSWFRVAATGLFFRRDVFHELGGFDPTLGLGSGIYLAAHDLDLVLRALEQERHIQYVNEPWVGHPQMLNRSSNHQQKKVVAYAIGAGRMMRDHHMPFWWVSAAVSMPLLRSFLALAKLQVRSAGVHAQEAYGRLCGWIGKGGGRKNCITLIFFRLVALWRS